MATRKEKDVLLDRRVQINEHQPYAGTRGTITKDLKHGHYEVTMPSEAVRDKVDEDQSRYAGESFVEGAERIADEADADDSDDQDGDDTERSAEVAAQIDHRAAWPFPTEPSARAKRAQGL